MSALAWGPDCLARGQGSWSPAGLCGTVRKQLEIAQKDERNQAIASQAKSKAFDMMTFSFGALMLVFALMQVDMAALLMLVFVYLLVHGYAVYCHCRYEKEM